MKHNRSPPRFLFYLTIINKEEIKVKDYKYDYKRWIVNTFLDNFYETILNSTGVL